MLRRSFLKACSAVSAMSVIGGAQSIASDQSCRTFADLYADWTLSKQTSLFWRTCEVNNIAPANASNVHVALAKRKASVDGFSGLRMLLVIRADSVWFMGRIRNQWGYSSSIEKHLYRNSISVLRDFVGHPVEQGLQRKQIVLPGMGEIPISIGERSASNGMSESVILCMGGSRKMLAEVVLSNNLDGDIKNLCRIDGWYCTQTISSSQKSTRELAGTAC